MRPENSRSQCVQKMRSRRVFKIGVSSKLGAPANRQDSRPYKNTLVMDAHNWLFGYSRALHPLIHSNPAVMLRATPRKFSSWRAPRDTHSQKTRPKMSVIMAD